MIESTSDKNSFFVSIRVKMLLLFTLLFTVVFALAFYWFFQFATQLKENELQVELAAIAETAANGINADEHTALYASEQPLGRPVEDQRYVDMVEWLALAKESGGKVIGADGAEAFRVLLYTYVTTNEPGTVEFIASSSALNDPPGGAEFREAYQPQSQAMLQGLEQTAVNLTEPIDDQWGRWVSAFAPIKDDAGNIVGAVGVDMRETTLVALQNRIRDAVIPAFLITYVVLFAAVWLLSYQISRPIVTLTQSAEQVADGNYTLDLVSDAATYFADETDRLAVVFQQMVGKVATREQNLKEQVQQLRIEIDDVKRTQQVSEIVETDFFQDLQSKARAMRKRRGSDSE
ncbi:MAG: HAMP domain-containing protein [Chloroflexota bacterium]